MSKETQEKIVEETQEKTLSMDDLKVMIQEGVKGAMKDDKTEERLKNIEKLMESKSVDGEEKQLKEAKTFVKDLVSGKLTEEKAISTDSGSFGYTVPTKLASTVLSKRDKIAKMRPLATTFKMSGPFQLPTEGTACTAYWVGENTEVTESSPTTGKKSLDDYYLSARVLIPYKLLDTSAINIVNYVGNLASRALNIKEETAFVAGDGSSKPTGLRQESVGNVYLEGASIAYNDLVNLFYELKEQYRKGNCVFLTSTAGIKLLKKIKDGDSRPIFDVRDNTIFGKPVLETEDIPATLGTSGNETEIWFGDFSYYWIKDGVKMIAESDKDIKNMQVEMVMHQATDGKLVLTESFKMLTGVK